MGFDGGYYMTCSKNFGRLLQASCLGLIGTLTVVGCGGSETKTPNTDTGVMPGPDGGGQPPIVAVSVSPASADFGSVVKGASSSAPTVITVTNRGVATSLSPAATGPFAVVSTTCGTLAAAGQCAISLSFTPAAVGPASGILTVIPGVAVTLVGTGVAPGAFTVSDKVDLGQVLVGATAAGTVTVSAISAVTGLACTTSGADIVADTTKVCPATLAAGASCTVGFNFKSATAGSKSDAVVCSATGVTLTSVVVAEVVTPAALAFAAPTTVAVQIPAGTTSSVISFNLVNSGGASSGLLTVTPSDTTLFVVDNQCLVPLLANSFCKINVAFKPTPTTTGQKTLTLTVTDASAPLTSVVATVNGTATPPGSLTLTGAATDFGTVAVGAASAPALVFTVANPGQSDTAPLTIGVTDAQFVVSADGCSGLALAAGKSCTVSLVFKPAVAGAASAVLSASAAGAAAATLPIKGLATGAAALSLTPATLDFGGVVVNATSGTKTFTVTNSGQNATGALEVVKTDSTSSVGGGSQFSYTTTCSAALAPNATCSVVVTFAPLQAGAASASITVRTLDLSTTSQAGTLLGLGLATADLTLSTAGTFDNTVVGATSPTVTLTLKNTGTTASGAITSTVTGDFAIATDNCAAANLVNNTSCTLVLTFKPTAKGSRTGVITVTSANSGSTNQQLSGTGLGVLELVEMTGTTCVAGAGGTAGTINPACTVQAQPYDFQQVSVGSTSTTTLTVAAFIRSNVGTVVSNLVLGTPADFSLAGSTCPTTNTTTTIAASTDPAKAVCYYLVTFTPTSKAAKTGSLTLTGASGATDTATLAGTGTGPLTISPSPASFQSVGVGSSFTLTLTVTNNSAATDVTAASYTLTGTNAADFVVVSDAVSGNTITKSGGANPTRTLVIRFVPSSTGAKTATVTVSGTFGAGTETATVTLTGTGGTPAQLTAALTGTIPDAAINGSSVATVTVTNGGAVATSNVKYSLTGTEFALSTTPASPLGTCGATNTTPLAPGASCTIKVWFNPIAGLGLGKRSGSLLVQADTGGSSTVALSANATAQLTISPSTIQDFGKVVLADSTSASKTFTVTNNASTAVSVSVASVTNVNSLLPSSSGLAAQYLVTNNCNAAIDGKGGTCTFSVQFVPTTAGVSYATLLVNETTLSPNQTVSVDVTGNGQNDAALAFTGATAFDRNFGQIRLGTVSTPVTYTLVNTGDVVSSVLSWGLYDVGGGNDGKLHLKTADFVTTGTTCPADTGLAAGATCNIVIAFSPTACSGGSCTTTGPVDVKLIVNATHGAPAGGVVAIATIPPSTLTALPEIKGTVTTTALPILVESTTGKSPFTYATSATAVTATMVLKAGSSPVTIGAGDAITFTDLAADGTQVSTGEFTVDATAGTNTCSAQTLVANGTCQFNVIWTPGATAGKRVATASFEGAVVTLVATKPVAATLVATPTAGLDFGALLQGSSSTMTLTVTNTGDLATTGTLQAAKAGSNPGDVTVLAGGCVGSTLAAGASCALSVKVTPSSIGTKSATVQVSATGATSTAAKTLSWVALSPAQLTVNPTSSDFGSKAVGVASTVLTVAVASVDNGQSSGALSISTDNADFSVTAVNPAGFSGTDCGAPAFASGLNGLAGTGTTCNIFVTFKPQALTPASKTGTLTVSSTSSAQAQVVLAGTAKAAISVDSTTFTFASTVVNAFSTTKTLTFTNATGAPTTGVLAATLSGTGAAQFRITTDNCTGNTLTGVGDATSSCTVIVRFDPTTAGAKAASLTVAGSPGNSAATALAGTATNT
jgi:hypothetical protein